MRHSMLTLIAATLLALPLAAQEPTRPERPARPAPAARERVAARGGDQITEAQRGRLEAIRSRYLKDARTQREALRERRGKMREELRSVLTTEQRARLDSRREMMNRREPTLRARMVAGREIRTAARVRAMRGVEMRGGRGMMIRRGNLMPMRERMGGMGRDVRPVRPEFRARPIRRGVAAPDAAPRRPARMRQGAPDQAPPAPAAAPARPEGNR